LSSDAQVTGALLRLPREFVVIDMLAAVNENGLDVTETELARFMYPGSDGRRPVEIARQCNTVAPGDELLLYALARLERRGYLERKTGTDAESRVVRMTDRGRRVFVLMRRCVADIEQEWIAQLGAGRFKALHKPLEDLSRSLGKIR